MNGSAWTVATLVAVTVASKLRQGSHTLLEDDAQFERLLRASADQDLSTRQGSRAWGDYSAARSDGKPHAMDLTGDGWLPLGEARKLARWWSQNAFRQTDLFGSQVPQEGLPRSR